MKYLKTEPYFTALRDFDLQSYAVIKVYLTKMQDFFKLLQLRVQMKVYKTLS